MATSPGLDTLASTDLEVYLHNDFKSLSQDELNRDVESFLSRIKITLDSSDDLKKKKALLSLNVIIDSDACNKARLADLIEPLKKCLSCSDLEIVKFTACAVAKVAVATVTTSTELFEKEMRLCNETLITSERFELKYFSVLVMKELATTLPSFFFQHIHLFFPAIFEAFRDAKIALREVAAVALKSVLNISCQRESQSPIKPDYYKQCMDEIERPYGEGVRRRLSLDEWSHGWMLLLLEMLRCCSADVEMLCYREECLLTKQAKIETYKRDRSVLKGHTTIEVLINDNNEDGGNDDGGEGDDSFSESKFIKEMVTSKILWLTVNLMKHKTSKYTYIHHCILLILPRIAALCPRLFVFNHLDETIEYIKSEQKGKDKALSFVCLGLLSLSMKENILRHKRPLFQLLQLNLVSKEKKMKNQGAIQAAVFSCVCMLADTILDNNNNNNNNNNKNSKVNNEENSTLSFTSFISSTEENTIENTKNNNNDNNSNNNSSDNNAKITKEEFIPFIECMFACALSPCIIKALERLMKANEALKRVIQINMLKKLHLILVVKELQHPYYTTAISAPITTLNPLSTTLTTLTTTSTTTTTTTKAIGALATSTNASSNHSGLSRSAQKEFCSSASLENMTLLEGYSTNHRKSSSQSTSFFSPQSSTLLSPSSLSSIKLSLPRKINLMKAQPQLGPNEDDIALALKTLGHFDLDGFSLTRLVEYCITEYLSHKRKDIRINTITTSTKLLADNYLAKFQRTKEDYMDLLTCRILSRILSSAVVDEDADIRYCVLSCLHSRFDHSLAQTYCLQLLSSCVNDEDIDVREMAVCLIGRLSLCNPSFVLPLLRKTIVRVLIELDYSGQDINKVHSSHLISHLARCAPNLIRTYARPIVDVIIPMLKDHSSLSTPVIIALLRVVGDIAQVTGATFQGMCDIIIPIIITLLQDSLQEPFKKRVALETLGKLVSGLCYPIEPYLKYPNLLDLVMSVFKSDTPMLIKIEAMKVLGTMGALDPFKLKGISNQPMDDPGVATTLSNTKAAAEAKGQEITSNELLVSMSVSSLDDFYPAVALSILLKTLKDPSLSAYHNAVVMVVSEIFEGLGYKGLEHLVKVVPLYCELIKASADLDFKKLLLTNMAVLTRVMKQYIKSYLAQIFILIHDLWKSTTTLTGPIIQLLESIVTSIDCEFRTYLPHFIPFLLQTFKQEEDSIEKTNSIVLMVAMQEFGNHLDDYIHFLLPSIIILFSTPSNNINARRTALETTLILSQKLDLSDFASRILLSIRKVMNDTWELNDICAEVVVAIASQLHSTSQLHSDLVLSCLHKQPSSKALLQYARKIEAIKSQPVVTDKDKNKETDKVDRKKDTASPSCVTKLKVDTEALEKAWKWTRWVNQDEWLDWLRRFNMELIKQSPSPSFRSLYSLANEYNPLAKELFNAAFVSCWTELTDKQQKELSRNLEALLKHTELLEVTQTMLNLSEFIEHCESCSLPLGLSQLSESALECRAYAKALHFTEVEFRNGPSNQILESLLSINNKLQQPEAAQGVLEYAKKQSKNDLKVQERWNEKLHDWSRALSSYEKQQEKQPDNVAFMLGRMRCLEALGEWDKLHDITLEKWSVHNSAVQENMARMSATAALGLGDWQSLRKYVSMIPTNTYDRSFYRGVISIYNGHYNLAQKAIDQARQLLITEMTTLSGEGYSRAYEVMVNVQMLVELEEVMEYKVTPEKREAIKELWWARLKGCQSILEDWQRFLQIRALVLKPQDDVRPWLKYASLCRKNNRIALAGRTITMLLGKDARKMEDEELVKMDRCVVYAFLKHSWSYEKERKSTFDRLKMFLEKISPISHRDYVFADPFLSKCYHRLAVWYTGLQKRSSFLSVSYFNESLKYNRDSIKAWHSFAYANYEVVLALKQLKNDGADEASVHAVSSRPLLEHCKACINGFIHSILHDLSTQTLQDTLRLLTLWFEYGDLVEVNQMVSEGFNSIVIENWIQVIPQLIARIDIKKPLIDTLIKQLLIQVARMHPQALIYPLTVALKSGVKSRSEAACVVINSMRDMYNNTVQQASVISEELIRVAILWHELWHEGLEEASRLYFGNKNIPGMLATLQPLHSLILAGPKTRQENSFVKDYGVDLNTAYECCCRYNKTRNAKELTQAWDIYYQVFRRITKQLPQLTALQLQSVSPKLLECENLDVTVPGTYLPNQPQINIAKVYNDVSVITSKQRPRKLTMTGSDGQDFQFLLKGHEDLRQDERVMQFFGLVNSILLTNPQNPRRNLSIQRYSVIPLSTNIGLIGWVPNCDTLHSLIRDYRDKKKILLNIEHRIMLRVFQDYERLLLLQKVEVFEHALESTKGDDLAQILWNKSASSEVWFDRRTNYTRSLAVMSVVGYVLGLGDRHPSNLMLDRVSGKIMHIDFGDCFEVAMHREKFPEKIPFRLTRMLINAMEVTGIDGNYMITCENVMKILRGHKDSLMAVLEAFIYDPLLNWKLLDTTTKKSTGMDLGNLSNSYTSSKKQTESMQSTNPTKPPPSTHPEEINKKGLLVLNRVKDKLTGKDFSNEEEVDVATQVKMLIDQATRHEHLCQCYIGWCPFW